MGKNKVTTEITMVASDRASSVMLGVSKKLDALGRANSRIIKRIKRLGAENSRLRKGMRSTSATVDKLRGKNGKLVESLRDTRKKLRESDKAARQAQKGLDKYKRAVDRASAANAKMRASTDASTASSLTFAKAVFGWYAAVTGTRALITTVNNLDAIDNRLRALTGRDSDVRRIRDGLFEISAATRQSFAGVATFYSRLAFAMRDTAVSERELMDVTTTLNKLMVASGTTTVEAEAAMIQFSQALASGRLAGEEYRSISEQVPIVLDAIAKHLGVTRKEIQKLAREQKLTTPVILAALREYKDEADRLFANTQVTLAQGWTMVGNAMTEYVGAVNRSLDVTKDLGETLAGLSENVRHIGNAVLAAGGAAFALFLFNKRVKIAVGGVKLLGFAMKGLLPFLLLEGVIYAWQALSGEFGKLKGDLADLADGYEKLWGKKKELQKLDVAELRLQLVKINQEHQLLALKKAQMEQRIARSMDVNRGGANAYNELGQYNDLIDAMNRLDEAANKTMRTIDEVLAAGSSDMGADTFGEKGGEATKKKVDEVTERINAYNEVWREQMAQVRADEAMWQQMTLQDLGDFEHQRLTMQEDASAERRRIWAEEAEAQAQVIDRMIAQKKRQQKAEANIETQKKALGEQALSWAIAIGKRHEGLSKAAFLVEKAIAVGNAIVNAHEAYGKALAVIPPPANVGVAKAMLALGYANAASMAAVAIGGMGGGGGGGGGGAVTTEPSATGIGTIEDNAGNKRKVDIKIYGEIHDRKSIIDLAHKLREVYAENDDTTITIQ